ncbi:hypothetical protein QBC41DRAFT_302100 [Cercophora samala]|uniref:Uncharacterized protein n=1 Tax=Cercophora samala TaxID=330535 RepID=A0AA39ZFQ3_9PEZI|nr:hypothetical protein QBC41DRAFT_302100 [Cercophora samala]
MRSIDGLDQKLADLLATVASRDGTIAGLDQKLQDEASAAADLGRQVAARDDTIVELNGTIAGLHARDSTIDQLNNELVELRATLATLGEDVSLLGTKVTERDDAIAVLEQEHAGTLARLDGEMSEFRAQIATLEKERAESAAKTTSLEDQLSSAAREHDLELARSREAVETLETRLGEASARAESHQKQCAELAVALRAEEEANPRKRKRLSEEAGEMTDQEKWEHLVHDMADKLVAIAPELDGPEVPTHKRILYDLSTIPNRDDYSDNWAALIDTGAADTWYCVEESLDQGHGAAELFWHEDRHRCPVHQGEKCLWVKLLRPGNGSLRTIFRMTPD